MCVNNSPRVVNVSGTAESKPQPLDHRVRRLNQYTTMHATLKTQSAIYGVKAKAPFTPNVSRGVNTR